MEMNKILIFILTLALLLTACNSNKDSKTTASTTTQQIPDSKEPLESSTQPSQSVSVAIQGNKFSPSSLKIKVGSIVTWTNMDSVPHNVKSSDGTLDSPDLFKGDSWSFTFTKSGTYNYICSIHPFMKGSITVD